MFEIWEFWIIVQRCFNTPRIDWTKLWQMFEIWEFCIIVRHCYNTMALRCSNVIMSAMVSQIAGVSMVCWTVCSGADQRELQSSASLAFVRGIHCWPVNSPHKGPVTRKMFPFDDVINKHGGGVQCQINYLPTSLLCYMKYRVILDRVTKCAGMYTILIRM